MTTSRPRWSGLNPVVKAGNCLMFSSENSTLSLIFPLHSRLTDFSFLYQSIPRQHSHLPQDCATLSLTVHGMVMCDKCSGGCLKSQFFKLHKPYHNFFLTTSKLWKNKYNKKRIALKQFDINFVYCPFEHFFNKSLLCGIFLNMSLSC